MSCSWIFSICLAREVACLAFEALAEKSADKVLQLRNLVFLL